jgi:hypothetical protein
MDNGPDALLLAIRVQFAPGALSFDDCDPDERAPGNQETPVLLGQHLGLIPHFSRGHTLLCGGLVIPEGATPLDVRIAGEDGPREILQWNPVADIARDVIHFQVLDPTPDD